MEDRMLDLLEKVERKYRIDFNVGYVEYSNSIFSHRAGCFYTDDDGEATIRIGGGFSKREFELVMYHELGHALLWSYEIPKKLMKPFLEEGDSLDLDETDFRYMFATKPIYLRIFPPARHFITPYASIGHEEDFCEIFAAVIAGYTLRRRNRSIKAKAAAVKEVIKFLRD